jgi:hypothetical protein
VYAATKRVGFCKRNLGRKQSTRVGISLTLTTLSLCAKIATPALFVGSRLVYKNPPSNPMSPKAQRVSQRNKHISQDMGSSSPKNSGNQSLFNTCNFREIRGNQSIDFGKFGCMLAGPNSVHANKKSA